MANMGYSGTEVAVCENGHLHLCDSYNDTSFSPCHCGSTEFDRGSIDQTNDPTVADFRIETLEEPKAERCGCCKQYRVATGGKYKMHKCDWFEWDDDGTYPEIEL
jgi:hypothetical protein